jgi:cobalt-zinc-cadmium resistance protein CzcA
MGQINSYYTDTRFGVSQSLNFPTVYTNQKKLLNEAWKEKVLSTALSEAELKKTVTQAFFHIVLLKEKEKMLQQADSLLSLFLSKAQLRFDKGETDILEKTSAEMQKGNVLLQLKYLRSEIETSKLQFQLLLNTEATVEPLTDKLKLTPALVLDTGSLAAHPLLKMYEQQKNISAANLKLEKSKLLPGLNLGYYNMSMRGSGADNITYGTSTRFTSVQAGLGVPLFFGSQKAKINASKTNVLIAENEYQQKAQQLGNEQKKALIQYKNELDLVNYFEQTQLPNAKKISETCLLKLTKGEINYLEWVMLNNQAIQIQSNYIDALNTLNETIIQINFLSTK